jgi:hypothetical protein
MQKNYARLKSKVKSFSSRGYNLKSGVWIEIKDEDVQYFLNSGRVEFAPAGIIPKDNIEKNANGIITLQGNGKESIVTTKEVEKIEDEFSDDESKEILQVRERYRRKRERKIKEEEEKKKEDKKKEVTLKDLQRIEKEKLSDIKDITNPGYIKKKQKTGDL